MNICRVATVPFFLSHHLRTQIIATISAGHSVTLVSSEGAEVEELLRLENIKFIPVNIAREISIWQDLAALWRLHRIFRKNRFDIIHSTTPKAGLLSAIAGVLAGVPIRIHTFTGQPWMEIKGIKRWVAKTADWVIAHLNTMNYADSKSQREFLIESNVASERKITTLGSGSLAGVDLKRFNKRIWSDQISSIRKELRINGDMNVICFIGRLTKDKGITELVEAFIGISSKNKKCILLLVGPQEPLRDPLPQCTIKAIQKNSNIIEVGYSNVPEKYLAITDIFCLPSYREGFGNVIIEAAAMGVPAVGTNIVGLRDAILDNYTGLLVQPKSTHSLYEGLNSLLVDPDLRLAMGERGEKRAKEEFDADCVNAAVLRDYERLAQLNLRV